MKAQTPAVARSNASLALTRPEMQFRYLVIIVARQASLLEIVRHRFQLEFGLGDASADFRTGSGGAEECVMVIPFRELLDGDRLPDFQRHAERVEGLFAPGQIRIRMAHLRHGKLTLAMNEDGPGRVYLRSGIWGEVAAEREGTGRRRWTYGIAEVADMEQFDAWLERIGDGEGA